MYLLPGMVIEIWMPIIMMYILQRMISETNLPVYQDFIAHYAQATSCVFLAENKDWDPIAQVVPVIKKIPISDNFDWSYISQDIVPFNKIFLITSFDISFKQGKYLTVNFLGSIGPNCPLH